MRMQGIKWSFVIQAGGMDEDRIDVCHADDQIIVVVADGAGGISGGAQAAEAVCAGIRSHADEQDTDWKAVLLETDGSVAKERGGGESTGVVVEVRAGMVRGAGDGDSRAWLISNHAVLDLTERQSRN